VKSEELEQSLRSEFESYLKDVIAKVRSDVNEFQKQIESEFDKQRSQIDDAFRSFSSRFDTLPEFNGGFRETVVEHLRLARDAGAQITATAMAEAEELERAAIPESVDLGAIREALDDISGKDTQSAILKSLISHAAKFTPRGAFFIIKNDHFAGWKVFGKEAGEGEVSIRDIHFPLASDSILSESVRSLKTVEGSFGIYGNDSMFLEPLHFGQPDRMYAIPLVARGRGVAVLYCDYGQEGITVNTEALEMLVKVAGLTVELLASAKSVQSGIQQASTQFTQTGSQIETNVYPDVPGHEHPVSGIPQQSHLHDEQPSAEETTIPDENAAGSGQWDPQEANVSNNSDSHELFNSGAHNFQVEASYGRDVLDHNSDDRSAINDAEETNSNESSSGFRSQLDTADEYTPHITPESSTSPGPSNEDDQFIGEPASEKFFESALPELAGTEFPSEEASEPWTHTSQLNIGTETDLQNDPAVHEPAMVFNDTSESFDASLDQTLDVSALPSDHQPSRLNESTSESDATHDIGGFGLENLPDPSRPSEASPQANGSLAAVSTSTIATKPSGTRLSDRNVDLPIEVSDDERRLHNDARRFARLLVSEIKLYNEKKVQEGRESNDLYDRLREAIDRSREMYDKRVQPPVAAKFDYFHYELVNSLAEGAEEKLGHTYKGARV
jgi:hypothetical protein